MPPVLNQPDFPVMMGTSRVKNSPFNLTATRASTSAALRTPSKTPRRKLFEKAELQRRAESRTPSAGRRRDNVFIIKPMNEHGYKTRTSPSPTRSTSSYPVGQLPGRFLKRTDPW